MMLYMELIVEDGAEQKVYPFLLIQCIGRIDHGLVPTCSAMRQP